MPEPTPLNESTFHTGLAAALPVVAESTTSRVLVNNPLVRVVQFTLDEGQLLTEHTSPRAVVVQLMEGTMGFSVRGEESILEPGDIVYLAPDAPHALRAITACRMSLVMVDVTRFQELE